ncbi:MAG: hypothetical protein M1818_002308 [Claussenomyces sp. TS43310]|nr:MAG: hypothetical protein M1818_002308 [Claussenomyces sp. TS43310]
MKAVELMAGLFTRQSNAGPFGGTTQTISLSQGDIVGIAVAGGFVIFGVLTLMLMHVARKHHRRKYVRRPLDLDTDTEVTQDVRSIMPAEMVSTRSINKPFITTDKINSAAGRREVAKREPMSSRTNLVPPSYHITGLRDSWPLVSMNQSPEVPMTLDGRLLEPNSPEAAYYAAATTTLLRPPEQVHSRVSGLNTNMRPSQSAQLSVFTDKRRSFGRRSVSENQLTSILRSTSQRLRDVRRRPVSRALSILSQGSGQPPEEKLPSPPKNTHGDSREVLVTLDQTEDYAESVKSSVLDMFSRTPSPARKVSRNAGSGKRQGRAPPVVDVSDDDSMYGANTPDIVIPAALTSPSKSKVRMEQRLKMRISSAESPVSIKIREDNRTSNSAFGGRDIFGNSQTAGQARLNDDPFVSKESSRRPLNDKSSYNEDKYCSSHGKAAFGQDSSLRSESPILPLKVLSGNISHPNNAFPGDKLLMNPFSWTNDTQLVVKKSPSPQKPAISRLRGHQRSKTIRLSGLLTQNVESVVEESENELYPKFEVAPTTIRLVDSVPDLSAKATPGSPTSDYSRIRTSRPPSVARFSTFLGASADSTQNGLSSSLVKTEEHTPATHSTTMSFYNLYSSQDAPGVTPSALPTSPPRSLKEKNVRHGRDPSISGSRSPGNASFTFPAPSVPVLEMPLHGPTVLKSSNEPLSPFDGPVSGDRPLFTIAPPSISRVHGPRSPPRSISRDSMQYSIVLLRRMNSDVSFVSDAGSPGDEGSPTLPALRGGGISPTKKGGKKPSNCYLSMGRHVRTSSHLSSPSRRFEHFEQQGRERKQESSHQKISSTKRTTADMESSPDRDFYDPPKVNTFEEIDMSNGLKIRGLKLPVRDCNGSPVRTALTGDGIGRWSDAMPQPPPEKRAVRSSRESTMQMPQAATPTKWGAGWERVLERPSPDAMRDKGSPTKTQRPANGRRPRKGSRIDVLRGWEHGEPEKRESLGLYDENGFLKSSPERRMKEGGSMENMI